MYTPARHRPLAALAALLIVAAGSAALVLGLSFAPAVSAVRTALETVMPTRSTPAETPTPPPPPPDGKDAPDEAPAPPARRAKAAQVVLPPPPRPPLVEPPPVPVATRTGSGSAPRQGSADEDGSGSGAGGSGDGTGGGGGNARENLSAWPEQVAGKLHYGEIPKVLRREHAGGVIRLRYRIGADGSVSDCRVLQSSGIPEFDADTCARITRRYRFRPARDREGRAVPFIMTETHGWDD